MVAQFRHARQQVKLKLNFWYSWPSLVWPYTEEPFSRPFVGENQFWLVLQNHISTENAVGCLFFHQEQLFFALHMHTASAVQWAFQMDLWWSRSHGFVSLTNPCALLQHKSIWNAHRAAEAVCNACEWRAKKSCSWWEKQAAYSILCAYMVLEH